MPTSVLLNSRVLGLIISISLLLAAGFAVYENPQVRQWVDESRRKVAVALHSLGDEIAPNSKSREASPDASTREDEDPEAVERRRRARQEILERGRMMEERRRSKQGSKGKAKSFHDLVDENGALKTEESSAIATSAEPQTQEESGLRHRNIDYNAAALRPTYANPFADEMGIESSPSTLDETANHPSRCVTPTLLTSPVSPPVPPKPAAYQPHRLLIDTDEVSNHPSEQLLDLTPTTSASSINADLAELNENRQPLTSRYWSVNEWAQNNAPPAFYSPPRSETAGVIEERVEDETNRSQTSSGEHASQIASEDMDILNDDEACINTPESWTEVGSQVSEDY